MNTFETICKLNQTDLKTYMHTYLTEMGYSEDVLADEDGFLYAKGEIPVLLVAHLDTVHKKLCTEIKNEKGKLSSPQGIGGDDRCGVFIIMNVIKKHKCSVLLCEDEEIGCVGAKKFANTDYIEDLGVNYMIEFDRKGADDAVFYSCDNADFTKFVVAATKYIKAYGSCSDISTLMPASGIAAVNLSCGYYNPHTTTEYVIYNEMMDTVDAASALIEAECDEPFKYIKREYPSSFGGSYSLGASWSDERASMEYYDSLFDKKYPKKKTGSVDIDDEELLLELEAVIYDEDTGRERVELVYGKTKAECFAKFFINNPDICYNDADFSWN